MRSFIPSKSPSAEQLWYEYAQQKQTYRELAQKYAISSKTIQRKLRQYRPKIHSQSPRDVVVLLDTTYWGRCFGVMLFKDAWSKKNLLKYYVTHETNELYIKGLEALEQQGFRIKAVVCDGRKWLLKSLSRRYPVQLCLYHQISAIRRYLAGKSKHPSHQELRLIAGLITHCTFKQMDDFLTDWLRRWASYYNERGIHPDTGKSYYLHRRLRTAFRSLINNLDYLFTYQAYPQLNIPNTTNLLEGTFSHLKAKLAVHRGLSLSQKQKIIDELLAI